MIEFRILLPVVLAAFVPYAGAQTSERDPRVGYLYPAGGRQATTFEVTAGGQRLAGVSGAVVTGEGVHVSVMKWYRPVRPLDRDQRELLQKRLQEVREKRAPGTGPGPTRAAAGRSPQRLVARPPAPPDKPDVAKPPAPGGLPERVIARPATTGPSNKPDVSPAPAARPATPAGATQPAAGKPEVKAAAATAPATPPPEIKLPAHPLLDKLDQLDLRQLQCVADEFLKARPRQMNPQIAELVVLRVVVDPGAPPGDRELRLLTPAGLSNPLCFQVGVAPEVDEQEPNEATAVQAVPPDPPAAVPVVFNGQIRPGDVDRFRFEARRGQRLVVTARARRLIPYLADAVPGWFQATLALFDAEGKELAFADDFTFDPDPVLFFEVPADGVYQLEIRDSIFRGREDFVYRITVGEQPFVTQLFPLGAQAGQAAATALGGWNLPATRLPLDTRADGGPLRQASITQGPWVSDPVPYAVGRLPESTEAEPDTTTTKAQAVTLPCLVNGRIGKPGDVDVFEFAGRSGEEVVAEVQARCYRSPLDSLLRVTDKRGKVIGLNDDCENKESGLVTHHADSYLRVRLPADGTYRVSLADAQRHGGRDYAYRLRLGPPQPDFALRVTPSSLNLRPGGRVPVTVHALRKDGFDGAIEIRLRDAPDGFALAGGRVPPGQDLVAMTLAAPAVGGGQPVALQLDGHATIGGEDVVRPAVPAEDRMQAFSYRHLAPSKQLLAVVLPGRQQPASITVEGGSILRIPLGGSTDLAVRAAKWITDRGLTIELRDAPAGVTAGPTTVTNRGASAPITADAKLAKAGTAGNLIVEVVGDPPPAAKNKQVQAKRRVPYGLLPPVAFEIVPAPAAKDTAKPKPGG